MKATGLTLSVNGRPRSVAAEDVAGLVEELGHADDRRGIAIALNGEVVPRSRWEDRRLAEGDVVEIVGAVQGG